MSEKYLQKIETLMDLKRHKQAAELCLKHLYSQSDITDALYYHLVRCYMCLDDVKNAEKFVSEALAKFPSDGDFYDLYSRIFVSKSMYDRAIEYIDKALKYDSTCSIYHYQKARILNFKKDFKGAKKSILIAIKDESMDVDFLNLYATILYNDSDDKYKEVIGQILSIDPLNAEALELKGVASKSIFAQKFYFLKALKLNPFDKDLQSSLKENKLELLSFFTSGILTLALILLNNYFTSSYTINLSLFVLLGISLFILAHQKALVFFFSFIVAYNFLYNSAERWHSMLLIVTCAGFAFLFLPILRNNITDFKEFIDGFKNSLEYKQNFGLKDFIVSKYKIGIYFLICFMYLSYFFSSYMSISLYILVPFMAFWAKNELNRDGLEDKIVSAVVYYMVLYLFKFVSNMLHEVCLGANVVYFHIFLALLLAELFVVVSEYEKKSERKEEI